MILGSLALMNNSSLNENISLSFKNISKGKPSLCYADDLATSFKRNKRNGSGTLVTHNHVDHKLRTRSVSNPVTPSMSAVISQIKQMSGEPIIGKQSLRRSFSSVPNSDSRDISLIDRDDNDDNIYIPKRKHRSSNDNDSKNTELSHPLYSGNSLEQLHMIRKDPTMKFFNVNDLDLQDSLTPEDIVQIIPPIYVRHKSDRKLPKKLPSEKKIIQENTKDLELEVWPDSVDQRDKSTVTSTTGIDLLPDNKKIRQRSMNPNFLKLLAIERRSIDKNILPEVHIDNQTFNSLSVHPDTQVVDSLDFNDDVRLAIKTKLKLWNDLGRGSLRNDLYGDAVPWNMKFIPSDTQDNDNVDSSLVRMNSTLKPWCNDSTDIREHGMLKPCGRFTNGSQYVVKGWCDSRFIQ
ncbi:similar to Saccharomyces cerevisiae YLR094C GIS3 Protein of unknown function [Maudiozyma barnettii]|uniref:Uncharacterized protein n=1 Tax=Maudiozyma barnettii TaxID=61262 RepID=A0A8H2VHT1_9SACH|nr:Gis3p [Kazachstania barnettii]CAB4255479.1 similar to Saccharomyces cerevisiae YLR094C GIS3 Protein of unknown function [Kazachstania barnettii]CAD1783961.1 similar to Saccharomyces cerevisiae YLR094C GIS3 Protein of unknown function [Kazachstania barnettii]